jgi:nucleotide-binding universal stress UspA family protein
MSTPKGIRKILVPVDYSEQSARALEYAAYLAAQLGATVDVVHVWDRPTYVSEGVMVSRPGQGPQSLVDMIRENAEQEMAEFLDGIQLPEGVTLTHHLISGEPASAGLKAIGQGEHDLVVVGTHGRTGVRHMLLGSVTEKLIRMAAVPVVTVPPHAGS